MKILKNGLQKKTVKAKVLGIIALTIAISAVFLVFNNVAAADNIQYFSTYPRISPSPNPIGVNRASSLLNWSKMVFILLSSL